MTLIIQILTVSLIFLSLFLIISVPIALAIRTQWEEYSLKYIRLSQLWFALVGATGLAASLTK